MKSTNEWGVLLKEEASYNAGGSVDAAADGFLVLEDPVVQIGYLHEGQRRNERGPMNVGMKRVRKSGRSGEATLVHEGAGAGEAYSATARPTFHRLLRILGFSATLDATVDAEAYTYALGSGVSALAEIYTREEMTALQAIYGRDLTISADGPVVPSWEVPIVGLMPALPTDAAVPSITYPSVEPPKAENIQLEIGDFASAVVREFTFRLNGETAPRADQNAANGHAGFARGARRPTLEMLIESDSLVGTPFHTAAGLNPYELQDAATALGISLVVGEVKYERWKLIAPAAQLGDPIEVDADGPTALWRLSWELNPTTPAAKDNLTIVAD